VTLTNISDRALTLTPTAAIPIYGRSADNLRDHRHVTSLLHRTRTQRYGVTVKPTLSFDERGHQPNSITYAVLGVDEDGKPPTEFFPIVEDFSGEGGTLDWPEAVIANKPGVGVDVAIAGYESMGGLRFVTGFPDRPPVKTGISIGDSIAALWGAIGALMALRHKEVNGGAGQVVDVALYEAVFAMMESLVPEFDVFGFVRERTGNISPGITPSCTHTTRDGKHVTIGANGDAIFQRFMRAIGRADLADDPTLADNAGRDARRDEIYALIDAWCGGHDEEDVLATLVAAEVPSSRVYSAVDMFADPQFLARGMLEAAMLPGGKPFRIPGIVPKLSATPGGTEWLGPALGAHTDAILAGLGYDPARIAALRTSGAI